MKFINNKIPIEYFYTQGSGESKYGGKGLPYEAGSYDGALNEAKIQNCNMIKYTSVVPPQAKEITRARGIKKLQWGMVLDSIMAQTNGKKDQILIAGLLITKVHDPKNKYLGGFACEYSEPYTFQRKGHDTLKNARSVKKARELAKLILLMDVTEMIERRGYGKAVEVVGFKSNLPILDTIQKHAYTIIKKSLKIKTSKGYFYQPSDCFIESNIPKTKYGTSLVAMCFTKYKY